MRYADRRLASGQLVLTLPEHPITALVHPGRPKATARLDHVRSPARMARPWADRNMAIGVQQRGTSSIPVQVRLDLPAPARRVSRFGHGLRRGAGEARGSAAGRGQRYYGSAGERDTSAPRPRPRVPADVGARRRSSRPGLALPPTGLPAVCAPGLPGGVNRTLACEMPGQRQRRGQPLVTAHLSEEVMAARLPPCGK
jgi:hypothetical protein